MLSGMVETALRVWCLTHLLAQSSPLAATDTAAAEARLAALGSDSSQKATEGAALLR
jgi:hypothetical protein